MFYNKATLWRGASSGGGVLTYVTGGLSGGYGVSSVTLPLSGVQAGDTVIVLAHAVRKSDTSGPPISCSISGYTSIASNTIQYNYSGVFWKRLTGVDTSIVVTSSPGNYQTAATYLVFRGANTSPISGSPTFSTGGVPQSQIDPLSVTPSVPGSVVIALGSAAVDDALVDLTALSTGYSNPQIFTADAGSNPHARAGMCWKAWVSGTENPSSFNLTYTNNARGVQSMSLILLPA